MNFRSLDLNLLRVFDAVVTEGNITRAAGQLSMTQPAVSNALKRLRESIGEDLLTRAPRGIRPTPYGEVLAARVREALGELHGLLEPDRYDPTTARQVFRMTMADAVAAVVMPALAARLQAIGSIASVEVRTPVDRDPRGWLLEGEVDFAIGHFPEAIAAFAGQPRTMPLRHLRLAEGRYVCAMRRGHPLASEPLTLEAFCAARHVLVSFSGRPHGLVDQALAGLSRTRRVAMTVNQFFTAAQVVLASDLLTVLPLGFIPICGLGERLAACELPLNPGAVFVDLLWHVRHERSAAHAWLRQQLAAIAQAAAPDLAALPA